MFIYNDWCRVLGMIMLIVYVGAVAVLFICSDDAKCVPSKNKWFKSSGSHTHIPIGLLVSLIIFLN